MITVTHPTSLFAPEPQRLSDRLQSLPAQNLRIPDQRKLAERQPRIISCAIPSDRHAAAFDYSGIKRVALENCPLSICIFECGSAGRRAFSLGLNLDYLPKPIARCVDLGFPARSEERRVGKEGRS